MIRAMISMNFEVYLTITERIVEDITALNSNTLLQANGGIWMTK
jgi:hypothetical protein